MYGLVYHDIKRPSPELLKRFRGIWASTLCDAMGRHGAMQREIRPIYDGIELIGSALTVMTYPGDNVTTHKALQLAKPGDVLAIDDGGAHEIAAFGHNMSLNARRQGVVGVVTNGSIRDLRLLREDKFPVFCTGMTPRSPQKNTPGSVNVPVNICGVVVRPGDIIVGDDDGVTVVPIELVEEVLEKAEKRMEMERQQAADVEAGRLPLEILFGPTWVDDTLKGKIREIGKNGG